MRSAPEEVYLTSPECLIVIFDLRTPDVADALDRQHAALSAYCDVEVLDEGHRALIIYPGWASESAA